MVVRPMELKFAIELCFHPGQHLRICIGMASPHPARGDPGVLLEVRAASKKHFWENFIKPNLSSTSGLVVRVRSDPVSDLTQGSGGHSKFKGRVCSCDHRAYQAEICHRAIFPPGEHLRLGTGMSSPPPGCGRPWSASGGQWSLNCVSWG